MAEVACWCKRAAEEQTKSFEKAREALAVELEEMMYNHYMKFAHATAEVKECLHCLVCLIWWTVSVRLLSDWMNVLSGCQELFVVDDGFENIAKIDLSNALFLLIHPHNPAAVVSFGFNFWKRSTRKYQTSVCLLLLQTESQKSIPFSADTEQ